MTMSTECPPPLFPESNCSGHGIGCVNLTCICEPGWTGLGDFVSGSPSCHLNIIAIQTLWGLVVVLHAFNIPWCMYFFFIKCRTRHDIYGSSSSATHALTSPEHQRLSCSSFTLVFDMPVRLGLTGFFTSLALISLGLIRVLDYRRTIGTDVAATVLFSISSINLWLFLPFITRSFLGLISRSLRSKNQGERYHLTRLQTVFQRSFPYMLLFCQLASISPLFTLIDPSNPWIMYAFAALHFVLLAGIMVYLNGLGQRIMKPVLYDMEEALEARPDIALQKIRWKFKRFIVEIRNQAAVQSVAAALFGFWPLAQRYSSYELPLAWMATSIFIALGLFTLLPTKSEPSSGGIVRNSFFQITKDGDVGSGAGAATVVGVPRSPRLLDQESTIATDPRQAIAISIVARQEDGVGDEPPRDDINIEEQE